MTLIMHPLSVLCEVFEVLPSKCFGDMERPGIRHHVNHRLGPYIYILSELAHIQHQVFCTVLVS